MPKIAERPCRLFPKATVIPKNVTDAATINPARSISKRNAKRLAKTSENAR